MARNIANTARMALVILLTSGIMIGKGQSLALRFDHVTSENGLPQNTIHGIVKDKYGFMWFGTWSGLCRYDGYSFKVYRNVPGNDRSLINSRIHNILRDSRKDLWILTFDQKVICKYNYDTDDFERIPMSKISERFKVLINRRDHYKSVAYRFKDYSWKMDQPTNSLLQTFIPSGKVVKTTNNPVNRWSLNDPYVTDIYLDNHKIFWVGTYSNGINRANLNAKPFHHNYHDERNANSIIDNNVRSICEDKQGNIWIGTRDMGISVTKKNGPSSHFRYNWKDATSISSDQIKKIFCDSRGVIWVGTKKGLDIFDGDTQKFRHLESGGLKNTSVFGIMEDRNGNIWLASWKGLIKYNPKDKKFKHFSPLTTLRHPHAVSVIEDRLGNIWVGTEGGGVSVLAPHGVDSLRVVDYFHHHDLQKNSVSDDRVYAILEDKEGAIWLGTGNGLDRYDPKMKQFKHFRVSPDGMANVTVAGIVADNKGNVWVSHKKGLSFIDYQTLKVSNFSMGDGLQSNEFTDGAAFGSKRSGLLYFGGNNGFNYFSPDSIKIDKSVPSVVLTDLLILNKPVGVKERANGRVVLDKPLYLTSRIELTHEDKSIAIEFAGLHYANPSGNKYAYLLEGFDKDWAFTDASRRVAIYSNLPAGEYTFKVKASNSDGIWNPIPQTLKIRVLPPWWVSKTAYLFYFILLIGLLYAFYYYSVRYARLKTRLSYEALLLAKELELRESKIEFFTNISHEIKTPLTLIIAPLERLIGTSNIDEFVANQLKTIKSNGDRLLKLVNQLLDIRRFESGHEHLQLEHGEIIGFLRNIVGSFRQFAELKKMDLQFEATVSDWHILVDADKIEKILHNLLSNAFKFTPDGGIIKVVVKILEESDKQILAVDVYDNGSGIEEKNFDKIFRPFQQDGIRKTGSTGLGLAYTKVLVELHGGTIEVLSGKKLEGNMSTRFSVLIPVTPASPLSVLTGIDKAENSELTAVPRTPKILSDSLVSDAKRPVLLLVEDNDELRSYIKDCFQQEYLVIEAADGRAGINTALAQVPDIIISDIMMPEVDGLEFCKTLKDNPVTSHIPIILLTATSPIENQVEGYNNGADDYIVKPFNIALLGSKMNSLLENRARVRSKYYKKITIQPSELNQETPDEKLLKRVLAYIEEKLAEPTLNVDEICDKIGLSRTQLYRKMKALTGLGMAEVIKELRLNRARQLLNGKKYNVTEVTFMVGFTDTDHFRRSFKAQFGISPSVYAKNPDAKLEAE